MGLLHVREQIGSDATAMEWALQYAGKHSAKTIGRMGTTPAPNPSGMASLDAP